MYMYTRENVRNLFRYTVQCTVYRTRVKEQLHTHIRFVRLNPIKFYRQFDVSLAKYNPSTIIFFFNTFES